MTRPIDHLSAHMALCKEQAGRLMVQSAQLLEEARRMLRRLKYKEQAYARKYRATHQG